MLHRIIYCYEEKNEGRLKKNSFFSVSGKLRLDKTAVFHYIIKIKNKKARRRSVHTRKDMPRADSSSNSLSNKQRNPNA